MVLKCWFIALVVISGVMSYKRDGERKYADIHPEERRYGLTPENNREGRDEGDQRPGYAGRQGQPQGGYDGRQIGHDARQGGKDGQQGGNDGRQGGKDDHQGGQEGRLGSFNYGGTDRGSNVRY